MSVPDGLKFQVDLGGLLGYDASHGYFEDIVPAPPYAVRS
jgi:hypothetical protein